MANGAPKGAGAKGGGKNKFIAPMIIKAKQAKNIAVLDSAGNAVAAYPILEFEISNGKPNYYYDVQVARRYNKLLSGGPGLRNAWDRTKTPKDRLKQRPFSSWSNGQQALRLDGSGKGAYAMPLDWWKDQARLPLANFKSVVYYYRVLAFPASNPAANQIVYSYKQGTSAAPHIVLNNNLLYFKVYKLRYHLDTTTPDCWRRYAKMEFKVSEANTTEMYNMVQWKKGGRTFEDKSYLFPVTDYSIQHNSHYPDWQIDWLNTNPRYWDGSPTINPDHKTAYYEDDPNCIPPPTGHTRVNCNISFRSKLYINGDIPAAVTISNQTYRSDGATDVICGTIDEDQSPVNAEESWQAIITAQRMANGTIHCTQG